MASVSIRLPAALSSRIDGVSCVNVNAASVAEALSELGQRHPGIAPLMFRAPGQLRPHVHVFVADRQVGPDGIDCRPLADGDELRIVPSIAGG